MAEVHTGMVVVFHIHCIGCLPAIALLYTLANPARSLLKRENITKIKSGSAPATRTEEIE